MSVVPKEPAEDELRAKASAVLNARRTLNAAINDAANAGLSVEVEVLEHRHMLGLVPIVNVKVSKTYEG